MTRIKLEVFVDLDPTPGAFHSAESASNFVSLILTDRIPHYNPMVSIASWDTSKSVSAHQDTVKLITDSDTRPGGEFFMNDEARQGWYCVRSTDPEKRDLFLPQHIFYKCFRLAQGDTVKAFYGFVPVQEIA